MKRTERYERQSRPWLLIARFKATLAPDIRPSSYFAAVPMSQGPQPHEPIYDGPPPCRKTVEISKGLCGNFFNFHDRTYLHPAHLGVLPVSACVACRPHGVPKLRLDFGPARLLPATTNEALTLFEALWKERLDDIYHELLARNGEPPSRHAVWEALCFKVRDWPMVSRKG